MRRRSRASSKPDKGRSPEAQTPEPRDAPTVRHRSSAARHQETEVARLTRDRDDAREQQKATAEILRVIRHSPADVQPVFETIVRSAVSLRQPLRQRVSFRWRAAAFCCLPQRGSDCGAWSERAETEKLAASCRFTQDEVPDAA